MDEVADRSEKLAAEEAGEEQESAEGQSSGFPARFLTRKWLLILLAVSLLGHGIGFAYFRLSVRRGSVEPAAEVALGVFRFASDPGEGGHIAGAEFSLHVALVPQLDQPARQALEAKKFRVQQAIEELIRAAHSGDFEDPLLGELKRQLQEQMNETLGMRAIADVIITELRPEWNANHVGGITETGEARPWAEFPSG